MNEGTCKHFTGIMEKTCKAGVCYRDAFNGKEAGIALRMPCFQFHALISSSSFFLLGNVAPQL